jgi:DNA polymerase III sliding clamp (beta) subunit (PCNA family)
MRIYKIVGIGNSQGIILPKKFLESINSCWDKRVAVEVNTEYKMMVIKPIHSIYNHKYLNPDYFRWLQEQIEKSKAKIKKRPGKPGR